MNEWQKIISCGKFLWGCVTGYWDVLWDWRKPKKSGLPAEAFKPIAPELWSDKIYSSYSAMTALKQGELRLKAMHEKCEHMQRVLDREISAMHEALGDYPLDSSNAHSCTVHYSEEHGRYLDFLEEKGRRGLL